jgi:hypothetical protein
VIEVCDHRLLDERSPPNRRLIDVSLSQPPAAAAAERAHPEGEAGEVKFLVIAAPARYRTVNGSIEVEVPPIELNLAGVIDLL